MVRKHKLLIGLLFLLSIQYGCAINQKRNFGNMKNKTIDDIITCKDSNYVNYLIVKNSHGKLYSINSINDKEEVAIIWMNGFVSTGLFSNNKPFGRWCVFDKKSRLRRFLFFGNDGDFLLQIVEFDKKGNIVKLSESSVPFN
jgi:hypothetical protein